MTICLKRTSVVILWFSANDKSMQCVPFYFGKRTLIIFLSLTSPVNLPVLIRLHLKKNSIQGGDCSFHEQWKCSGIVPLNISALDEMDSSRNGPFPVQIKSQCWNGLISNPHLHWACLLLRFKCGSWSQSRTMSNHTCVASPLPVLDLTTHGVPTISITIRATVHPPTHAYAHTVLVSHRRTENSLAGTTCMLCLQMQEKHFSTIAELAIYPVLSCHLVFKSSK